MDTYNDAWKNLISGNLVVAEASVYEHLKGVKEDKHATRLLEIIQNCKKQDRHYVNAIS